MLSNPLRIPSISRMMGLLLLGLATVTTVEAEPVSYQEAPARTYVMGMGYSIGLPKDRPNLKRKRFESWKVAVDVVLEHHSVPWRMMLVDGVPPAAAAYELLWPIEDLVRKTHGKRLMITIDPLDPVDRRKEAKELRELGRSIIEADIQRLYLDYVLAVAEIIHPDYLGLAAEVNFFEEYVLDWRAYEALVSMLNDTANVLDIHFPEILLYVSFEIATVWGLDFNGPGEYVGLDRYLEDFPFLDAVGYTVYPAPYWFIPKDVPDDVLTRAAEDSGLPVIVPESGWPSDDLLLGTTPEQQKRWVKRLAHVCQLGDCVAIINTLSTDIDSEDESAHFGTQGLFTSDFQVKPAMEEWLDQFRR